MDRSPWLMRQERRHAKFVWSFASFFWREKQETVWFVQDSFSIWDWDNSIICRCYSLLFHFHPDQPCQAFFFLSLPLPLRTLHTKLLTVFIIYFFLPTLQWSDHFSPRYIHTCVMLQADALSQIIIEKFLPVSTWHIYSAWVYDKLFKVCSFHTRPSMDINSAPLSRPC